MNKQPRRDHSPAFRKRVVLVAGKGEKTLVELARQYDVYPVLINYRRASSKRRGRRNMSNVKCDGVNETRIQTGSGYRFYITCATRH